MSKELEALENIKHYDSRVGLHEDDYKLIESALKRLEKIETTTHSVLREDISNKLKALEIIKKGCPYISLEKQKNIDNDKSYVLIIGGGYDCAAIELTQEEYELLREVLL